LVHAGGGLDARGSQSDPARELILGAGIDAGRVTFESTSTNTCEDARSTHELVLPAEEEVWLLVTSAAHVPRAVACFRAAGWEVTPYPTDFKGDLSVLSSEVLNNLVVLDYAAHEWVGLVYYRLRGWTREFFTRPSS
jgi:uncharacterized SAM-binding protein YcdF (DUF218 family)